MKSIIKTILFILCIGCIKSYAQCPDVYSDINTNPYVCGNYGDAAGNSNWNWEITNASDPNYCAMWYARASSIGNKLTLMGSPFTNASTGKMDIISQEQDFTRAKGWELLRRDFGCSHVTAYPYFVLYNRYSGLIRVYVYQPETQQQYSSVMISVKPTKNPYPAVTALADETLASADKYLSGNQSQLLGKELIAVGDNGGGARWVFAEINLVLDPNIQNALYNGTGLEFKMYGVQNSEMKAEIKGRSVSGQSPSLYDFNYTPKTAPTNSNGSEVYTAAGEKFLKGSKQLDDLATKIKNTATVIYDETGGDVVPIDQTTVLGQFRDLAKYFKGTGFEANMKFASTLIKRAGNTFKFIGSVIGLFSGGGSSPAAMPTYTSYQFVLNGTLTAKSVQQTFVLRVPGTLQPNNDNKTYYQCPLGIFNLANTPEADVITYQRRHRFNKKNSTPGYETHKSYRIRNNITVTYNDGAGLELVSAQACFIGESLPTSQGIGYELFDPHDLSAPYESSWNLMLPEFESGRMELVHFDAVKNLNIYQTPFVNIECLNGLAFNVKPLTKVYLQVRAVLRKKNDPDDKPIVYSQSYNIDTFTAAMSNTLRNQYASEDGITMVPPYANHTQAPLFVSNRALGGLNLTSGQVIQADNIISSNGLVPSNALGVVLKAGNSVLLTPGFEAVAGSDLSVSINKYGYNITCGIPSIQAYQHPEGCYNTSIQALRTKTEDISVGPDVAVSKLNVYPTISSGNVNITGDEIQQAKITIVDQSGRIVYQYNNRSTKTTIQLNLHHLSNGVYFIKIESPGKTVTKKLLISK